MVQYPWLVYVDSAIDSDRKEVVKNIELAFRHLERISDVNIPRKEENMVGRDTLLERPFENILHNVTFKDVLVNGKSEEVSFDYYLSSALHVHNDMLSYERRMPAFGNLRCNYSYTHVLSLAVIAPYIMSKVGNVLAGNSAPIRGKGNTEKQQLEWNFEHGAGATLSYNLSENNDYKTLKLNFLYTLKHELAHTYGISHCKDKECIMYPYTLVQDMKEQEIDFCEKHEKDLKEFLWKTY